MFSPLLIHFYINWSFFLFNLALLAYDVDFRTGNKRKNGAHYKNSFDVTFNLNYYTAGFYIFARGPEIKNIQKGILAMPPNRTKTVCTDA